MSLLLNEINILEKQYSANITDKNKHAIEMNKILNIFTKYLANYKTKNNQLQDIDDTIIMKELDNIKQQYVNLVNN